MFYFLHASVIDANPKVRINERRFRQLAEAREVLRAGFALEEMYDLVLENYRELEGSALEASLRSLTQDRDDYADNFAIRTEFNRRTLNLLSSVRLYLDQHQSLLRDMQAPTEEVETLRRKLYDTSFEYRFMEALRNHVQHAGRAVHGVRSNSSWLPSTTDKQRLEFHVVPYAMKSELDADPQFKKTVLAECPETIKLLPAARKHVEGISHLHDLIRRLTAESVGTARIAFEWAVGRHTEKSGRRFVSLTANLSKSGVVLRSIPVFLEWDDVRKKLARINCPLLNLGVRHVSSADDA